MNRVGVLRTATLAVLIVSVVIAGCSTVAPVPSSPSDTPAPSVTPRPTPDTTPPPSPMPPAVVAWEPASVPDSRNASGLGVIAQAGDGLIAIGSDGGFGSTLWTSADGRTWTDITPDGFESIGIASVVEYEGMLVGVGRGNTIDVDTEEAAVYLSDDGTEWRKVETADRLIGQMIDVVATDHGLYAVGGVPGADSAGIWRSTDGESWERTGEDIEHAFIWSIAEGGPGLVAVGWRRDPEPSAAVWTSVDGNQWTLAPDPEGYQLHEATDVIDVDGTLTMVGSAFTGEGGRMWTSSDGLIWEIADAPELVGAYARSLVETPAGIVAVGGSDEMAAAAWVTFDGRTWRALGERVEGAYFHTAFMHDGRLFTAGATQAGTLETGIEAHAMVWSSPLSE